MKFTPRSLSRSLRESRFMPLLMLVIVEPSLIFPMFITENGGSGNHLFLQNIRLMDWQFQLLPA
uniref:Uncharacterized protein n=1 Tax=Rhizophora mucronata TaxID=61149 RepID=A0A2P2PZI9_RHIMU